jgi:hypothetical protein
MSSLRVVQMMANRQEGYQNNPHRFHGFQLRSGCAWLG